MNIDSKTLLLFLEKNIENKYISIPKTHLSKFSISLIKDIFRHMILAEKSYTAIPGQWIHTDSFPKGYDFDYCHDIIKTEIENMNKTTCIYSFIIKNHFK